jgi:hypothetical protein
MPGASALVDHDLQLATPLVRLMRLVYIVYMIVLTRTSSDR